MCKWRIEVLTAAGCVCYCDVQVVIFVKSVQRCVALAQLLVEQNFPAIAIHRGMPQEERYLNHHYNTDNKGLTHTRYRY